MWVADADWPTAEPVIKALVKRARHGIFGYTKPGPRHNQAIQTWVKQNYDWEIDTDWIIYTNGVVPSISFILKTYLGSNDPVIVQPPVYYPFFRVVKNRKQPLIENPLVYNERYQINFGQLSSKLNQIESNQSTTGTCKGSLILCSPHNPVGRVWTTRELKQLGELCLNHDLMVISDEIHADFTFEGHQHHSFASLTPQLRKNSITLLSPSKAFNLAGISQSVAIIPNSSWRQKFQDSRGYLLGSGTIFGLEALHAAYTKGQDWLNRQLDYLQDNRDYALSYVRNNIPGIQPVPPEGTYLLWLDCRELQLSKEELEELMTKKAEVGVDFGHWFGTGGEGFLRLNMACPRDRLKEGLKRIKGACIQYFRTA